jgi:cell division protein FtsB
LFEQLRKFAMGKRGALILLAIVIAYAWIAVSGPQGLQTLLDKRREIRELQEQNAALTREIEHRLDRIRRLEVSPSEQEMEIRKQLKLQKPGETTFILPDGPKDSDK